MKNCEKCQKKVSKNAKIDGLENLKFGTLQAWFFGPLHKDELL